MGSEALTASYVHKQEAYEKCHCLFPPELTGLLNDQVHGALPRQETQGTCSCRCHLCLSESSQETFSSGHPHWGALGCWSPGQAEALKEKGGKGEQLLVVIGWPRAALSASSCVSAAIGDVSTPPRPEMFWLGIKSNMKHLPSTAAPHTQYTTCQLAAGRKEGH